ncbi:unnamed protein product [Toxocara canis]|uniref:Uncharacterized protein n=1 Tax=Toxocara canis TaxID=6265 RepID=A0A183VH39_TOXCA|nr:unnamed protein product [Toxocara canis]
MELSSSGKLHYLFGTAGSEYRSILEAWSILHRRCQLITIRDETIGNRLAVVLTCFAQVDEEPCNGIALLGSDFCDTLSRGMF